MGTLPAEREEDSMATFGVLCGGGPAPGLNGVIGAAVLQAARHGHRTIGLYDGFKWIMEGDTHHVVDLDPNACQLLHLEGGSIIHTSRANPTKQPDSLERCVKSLDELGIDHLITLGGDDTAFSSRKVAEAAENRIKVIHVPKTIDNDLPLPEGVATFGYETARELGASVVERIQQDCITTNRWFILVLMGRKAGFLSLGAGKSAGAPLTLIPEEFPPGPIRFDDVVRTIEGSIVKRMAMEGRSDGVVVVAEGLVERMPEEDLEVLKDVPRDEHGHIRLADVPFGKILKSALADSLGARGIQVPLGEKDVGYELRCGRPLAWDRDYTRDLGAGAVELLLAGHSSVMVTRLPDGSIRPVPFEELADPETGKTRVRYVDVDSNWFKTARALQVRVEASDLEDPTTLARLAETARLSEDDVKKRYAPI
jgi:6-phosphofructokinase